MYQLFDWRSESRIWGQNMSNKIFNFLWNLIFCLWRIFRKSICSCCNPNCIRINKRMNKITKCIQHTSSHPNISLIVKQIFRIRINNLWRSIHWCCHAFDLFFNWIIIFFTNLSKVINLFCTRTKITQLVFVIFSEEYVLDFDVTMIVSSCVNCL